MKCGDRPLRALPARARRSSAATGRSSAGTRSSRCSRCGSCEMEPRADSSPSGSSPPATAASSACSTARTSCSRSPAQIEIAYFLEATSATVDGPVRPLARRGLDHDAATTPSGSSEVRARVAARWSRSAPARPPGGIQALRNFADVDDFVVARLRDARVHLDARDLDADRRPRRTSTSSCSGCPINKRQLLEVISAFLNERRPGDRRRTASASSASGAATSA